MKNVDKIFFKWVRMRFSPKVLRLVAIFLVFVLPILTWVLPNPFGFSADKNPTLKVEEHGGVGGGNEEDLPPFPVPPLSSIQTANTPDISGYFPDDLSAWSYEDYYQSKSDQPCAKADSGYESAAMWLNKKVPLVVDEIDVSFVAQPSQEDNGMPAPVVLFLGNYEEIPLFRCLILENSFKQIGCHIYDHTIVDGEPLRRVDPYFLKKGAVKPGSIVDVTIQSMLEPDGLVRYTLSLDYESDLTGDREEDGMEIGTIRPPYQNLEETRVQFGIGTVERECINPILYRIYE